VPAVERRIYFYRISFTQNRQPTVPEPIFAHIARLPFEENGCYSACGDGNFWAMIVDSTAFPLKARIGTIRRTGLPLLEQRGRTYPLDIPPDSGLFEPMHFVIFPNRVAGFEYNFYGPRPQRAKYYLPEKAPDLVDDVDLELLMRRDVRDLVSRVGEIRILDVRVHRDNAELLRDLDSNLFDAIDAAKKSTDAENIEVTLRSTRYSKRSIELPWWPRVKAWISRQGVREGLEEFRVRCRDLFTKEIVEFDLLEGLMVSTKRVLTQQENSKAVNSEAMYDAIQSAYDELLPEIRRIIGG
jgi:hypothetical protein